MIKPFFNYWRSIDANRDVWNNASLKTFNQHTICSGNFTLISAQDSGFGSSEVEYAYQLMIRSAKKNEQMLSELEKVEGIENINLTMQEQLLEV